MGDLRAVSVPFRPQSIQIPLNILRFRIVFPESEVCGERRVVLRRLFRDSRVRRRHRVVDGTSSLHRLIKLYSMINLQGRKACGCVDSVQAILEPATRSSRATMRLACPMWATSRTTGRAWFSLSIGPGLEKDAREPPFPRGSPLDPGKLHWMHCRPRLTEGASYAGSRDERQRHLNVV